MISIPNPYSSCLQEIMLPTTFCNTCLNYNFYIIVPIINTIGKTKGGSAIIVKSNTCHDLVALKTLLQVIAVKVVMNKRLTICFLYLKPI